MKIIDNLTPRLFIQIILKMALAYVLGVGLIVSLMLWLGTYEFFVFLIIITVALGVLQLSLCIYSWIRSKTNNLLIGAAVLILLASFIFGLYDVWLDMFSIKPEGITPEIEATRMRLVLSIKILGFVVPAILLAVAANVITIHLEPLLPDPQVKKSRREIAQQKKRTQEAFLKREIERKVDIK